MNGRMQIYLVGGAVRDALLGLPVREHDWVVVGANPEEMTARGFRAVGREFPVFLHPETGEEYALARTERKTGPGYRGFVTRFSPDVTLAEDLGRRDLTINAIAQDPATNELIDPFGGRRDIEQRLLRHVSPAFTEDPVRVLRVARFAARFHPLGFAVAPETLALLTRIAAGTELDALVPERVWQETVKALSTPAPAEYFRVLRDCGALAKIFPELDALFGVPQPPAWHPEVDTGLHALLVLEQAAALSQDPQVRFAALVHDLGKGATPRASWPKHIAHETRGLPLLETLCDRLRIPNDYRELARHVMRHHGVAHRALELKSSTLLRLLEAVDAFRRPQRFEQFVLACMADMKGRTGLEERPYPQADLLRAAYTAAATAVIDKSELTGLQGPQIGERLRKLRLDAIRRAQNRVS